MFGEKELAFINFLIIGVFFIYKVTPNPLISLLILL